jgi:hypothetical protein
MALIARRRVFSCTMSEPRLVRATILVRRRIFAHTFHQKEPAQEVDATGPLVVQSQQLEEKQRIRRRRLLQHTVWLARKGNVRTSSLAGAHLLRSSPSTTNSNFALLRNEEAVCASQKSHIVLIVQPDSLVRRQGKETAEREASASNGAPSARLCAVSLPAIAALLRFLAPLIQLLHVL